MGADDQISNESINSELLCDKYIDEHFVDHVSQDDIVEALVEDLSIEE